MNTEIYRSDLNALAEIFDILEEISSLAGVYQTEIRVKFDEDNTWAVVGWGESGDPCLLRFDHDPVPAKIIFPTTVQPFKSGVDFNVYGNTSSPQSDGER